MLPAVVFHLSQDKDVASILHPEERVHHDNAGRLINNGSHRIIGNRTKLSAAPYQLLIMVAHS